MNRVELMRKMHEKTGIESHNCIKVIDALFGDGDEETGIIADALWDSEEPVTIPKFGTFHKVRVPARDGKAPNGTPWHADAHWRPAFRPSRDLKERVSA